MLLALSSFPKNLPCFAANCNMTRITRFLCYFVGLKFASVLSITLIPSLSKKWPSNCLINIQMSCLKKESKNFIPYPSKSHRRMCFKLTPSQYLILIFQQEKKTSRTIPFCIPSCEISFSPSCGLDHSEWHQFSRNNLCLHEE